MTEADSEVDLAGLESYLSSELGTDVRTEAVHEGLNLHVECSTGEDGEAYVLRRPKKLRDTHYMNDVKREFEILERLGETAIATPDPVFFCDDESVIGERFFVMTRLDGAPVPLGSDLPERFRDPNSRERVADLLIDALADVHTADVEPFESVCERVAPREQVVRATDRLEEVTSVTGRELPRLRSVGDWLRRNGPTDPETTLVHGDFRPGNVLLSGTERPEVSGVLDWESAMLGDPLTELGYLLLRWRDDGDPTPPLDELEASYSDEDAIDHLREVNETGLAPFTAKPGSPSRRELIARYEERTGLTFDNERFYIAQAAFLLAMVWEDLHRHRIESGAEAEGDPHVEYVAMLAESIVDGEFQV